MDKPEVASWMCMWCGWIDGGTLGFVRHLLSQHGSEADLVRVFDSLAVEMSGSRKMVESALSWNRFLTDHFVSKTGNA